MGDHDDLSDDEWCHSFRTDGNDDLNRTCPLSARRHPRSGKPEGGTVEGG